MDSISITTSVSITQVGPARSAQDSSSGILGGKCRCVWNGKAVVQPKAPMAPTQNKANHNLLLSDKAEIDAKPELEIYADEVKCSPRHDRRSA